MFKLYQRYLAANFIPPFFFSAIFFVSFLLTFQLFRVMQVVIGKSVDLWVVLELIGHIAISFLPMAVPISILFAAIFTMNKFSEDSEIVAMRSFGATKFNLFLPFLVVTLLVALTLFSLNRSLIPQSRTQFRNTLIVLSSQGMLTDVRSEQFYMDIPGVTLFAESVEDGEFFEEVFIVFSERRNQEQVITAKTGTLIKQYESSEGFSFPSLRLHLKDGSITTTYTNQNDIEVIHFTEYDFPLMTDSFHPSTIARDSMRTNRELSEMIKFREDQVREFEEKAESLTGREQRELRDLRESIISAKLEFWIRFNIPVQCIVFSLLGFSLGVKQGRGRSKNSGALSIMIVIGYYAFYFGAVSLAESGILSPFVTTFAPTFISGLIALYFFKKVDWLS